MTEKALKLLLSTHAKATCWFIGIYALIMTILLLVFSFLIIDDTSWIPITLMYTPKIYLLVMGIVYPLVATELYVSRGLTRRQFFWAFTGAMSIISLFLFIPILATIIYFENISLLSTITHFLHLPLFFLIGWTSIVGFQLGKGSLAILGILCAIVSFHIITTVPQIISFTAFEVVGAVLLLLATLLLILPRIISQIPLKS